MARSEPLAGAPADRGSGRADQRRRMKRPFKKRSVERLLETGLAPRLALVTPHEDDEREIRPGRLSGDRRPKLGKSDLRNRFIGDDSAGIVTAFDRRKQ